VLLGTTNQWLATPFPRATQYPRRGGGRKGAFGVACGAHAMAPGATLAPVTTTSTAARIRERGRSRVGLGNAGQQVRTLCVPYRTDTHGLSRLITVSRNGCSTAVSRACRVVPKLIPECLRRASAPGWPQERPRCRGSPTARVSHRVGAEGVADRSWWARSFNACGAPPGPPAPARSEASSPTRRDTHFRPSVLRQAGPVNLVILTRALRVAVLMATRGQQRSL